MMPIEQIARICHETLRAYSVTLKDYSQRPWDDAPDWQRQSSINGVRWRLDHPAAAVSAQHDQWLEEKKRAGWTYATVKDSVAKTHPCMVPYAELPSDQRIKDTLFVAVVEALRERAEVH